MQHFPTTTKFICLAAGALLASASFAQTTFTQVTNGPIATDSGDFIGAAWGDFYNHGLLDLIDANWGGLTNVFYRNEGNGIFTKMTGQDPVLDLDYHVVAIAGDYDNDGNLDLVVSSGAAAPTPRRTLVYHNNGGGNFSRVSGGTVTNQLGYFGDCKLADYDNDGFLDLFVTDFGPSGQSGAKNLLFHNNGNGTFSVINNGPVANDVAIGYDASWIDYDDDGSVDLLVINRFLSNSHNFLYHNNGDGTFRRILTNAIATDIWPVGAAFGVWGDYDNDGLLDLFVTDSNSNGARNRLYHNVGNGTFTNVTSGPTLPLPSGVTSYGCAWGDYDNDGHLDLFVVNYGGNNALFRNNGNGTFTRVSAGAPTQQSGGGACYWVDYDNDGFLDLFLSGGAEGPLPHLFYHNIGNTNAWLEVNCIGTVANRSAIGAKVRLQATIGGKTFWQVRAIGGQGQPLVAHFGLGDATNVDTLRIEWPSRTVQELHNVTPRKILTVTEPARLLATLTNGGPRFYLKAWPGMRFDIQASTDLTNWSALTTVTVAKTNLNGITEIIDTNAPSAYGKFYRASSR